MARTAKAKEADGRPHPIASLVEIARVLDETARIVRAHAAAEELPESARLASAPADLRYVRALIAARLLRAEFLGLPPGDHAFSMMLELYAARLEGRRVGPTRLGASAGLAGATTVRIVRSLVDAGILVRVPEGAGDRRPALDLSDDTARRLRAYLAAAIRMGAILP